MASAKPGGNRKHHGGTEAEDVGDRDLAGVSPGDLITLYLVLSLCSLSRLAHDFLSRALAGLNWWGLPASAPF